MLAKKYESLPAIVREKLARIKLLLMDVDGVLTDGRLWLADQGVESKRYSTRDGFAIVWSKQYGLLTGVISGRKSAGTQQRCQDLKMDEIHLGYLKKVEIFTKIAEARKLKAEEIAFIGDDLIDIPLFLRCGNSAAPRDAQEECFKHVDIRLDQNGGDGAVREWIDLWLMATGQWDKAIDDILHGKY